jgi:hypothetical protein
MIPLLAIVTLVALTMAIGLSVIVARLIRDERRRSAARVAALSDMAAIDPPSPAPAAPVGAEEPRWRHAKREGKATPPKRIEPLDDYDLSADRAPIALGEMFVEPDRRSPWAGRLGVAAAIAVLVAGAALGVTARRPAPDSDTSSEAQPQAAAPSSPGSLELLSLQHSQKGETLTITGQVQNPRAGAPLAKISVTAFLFGADGTFLASGRTPLDFTLLAPGDESGFVLAIPVNGPVARYRIGFRGEDGRVIGHVDRRDRSTIASNDK